MEICFRENTSIRETLPPRCISRMQIEELLLQFQPTILLEEHDKAFRSNAVENVAP